MADLARIEAAAKALGVQVRSLQRYARAGAPHEKRGRALWFDVDAVRAWMLEPEVDGKTRGRPVGGAGPARATEGSAGLVAASSSADSTPSTPDEIERLVRSRVDAELARATEQLREQLRSADLRKKKAEAEAKELANAGKRGRLVDRADVEKQQVAAILLVKRSLEVLPSKLAARLVGRTREEIHEDLTAEVDSVCRLFSEEFAKL